MEIRFWMQQVWRGWRKLRTDLAHGVAPWWNEIKEPCTLATAQNFVNSIINNPFHSHLKKKKLPFLQNGESDRLPSWERKVKNFWLLSIYKIQTCLILKTFPLFSGTSLSISLFQFWIPQSSGKFFFLKNSCQSSDTMVFAWFPRRQDALRKVHSVKMTAGVASRYWPCLLPCGKVYDYIIYHILALPFTLQ